jgi:hypothetical protein
MIAGPKTSAPPESVPLGDDEGSEGEGCVVVGSMLLFLFECFSGSWANSV